MGWKGILASGRITSRENWNKGRNARSALRGAKRAQASEAAWLAANGAKNDGSEIWIGAADQCSRLVEGLISVQLAGELRDCGHGDHHRRRIGLRVDGGRPGVSMERSIRQVDVRQHHDQQHEKNHATEDEERRRLNLPLR